jgi:hypothetical protein
MLDPNDAGFLPEVSLPALAVAARQDATRAALHSNPQVCSCTLTPPELSLQALYSVASTVHQVQCNRCRVATAASQLLQHPALVPPQAQQQRRRQTLRPSSAQTAAAAGLQQPPPLPAAQRGPEGVLADDDDDDDADAAHEAAIAAAGPAPPQARGTNASTSDTLAALLLLASQFPAAARAAGLPPIMLKAQVYAIVADRTAVDRDLEQLR